ncbi:hypothetical protein F5148DRAFT_1165821 [Russula earlei]|uniref:Uncharacterized protein n=1 Tax=Russula earlei TaxID=71964 RepID=A0ACC0UMI7_9AGAM|nr:hypothetical protein F5148DRAFT_1165821 [Russula earlei]
MVSLRVTFSALAVALAGQVSAHISIWHNSMFGFNQSSFGVNRPQDPLAYLPFDQWWFHGHIGLPPNPNDIMQLPVGGNAMVELSCDKGATSWYQSAPGGDTRDPNNPDSPCPGQPTTQYHTNGINDLGGCALSVAYKSDINQVQPEDLVIFSVNHVCVWNLHTYFPIPANMPPCPSGKCICAWHWIHQPDSGSEQMYMNGFQCNFANATSTTPLAKPQVARRCGAEPDKGLPARPENCTYGAKSPLFWLQNERNNMFEGYYSPPLYQDLYNFANGAQNDIFEGYPISTPAAPSDVSTTSTSTTSSTSSPLPSSSLDAPVRVQPEPISSSAPPSATPTSPCPPSPSPSPLPAPQPTDTPPNSSEQPTPSTPVSDGTSSSPSPSPSPAPQPTDTPPNSLEQPTPPEPSTPVSDGTSIPSSSPGTPTATPTNHQSNHHKHPHQHHSQHHNGCGTSRPPPAVTPFRRADEDNEVYVSEQQLVKHAWSRHRRLSARGKQRP